MRDTFVATTTALLSDDPRTAVVLADISAGDFAPAMRRHPDRVINVGIREQLMAGVAGGLALTGMRPYVHSYAPFLVDRAYEQIKLDLGHQDTGAVLVSIGASYDASNVGYTHQSPGDVALLDTLDGWTVHVPGHPDEVARPAAPRPPRPTTGCTCGCPRRRTSARTARSSRSSAAAGPAPRSCWRSARCSTRCWPRSPDLDVTVAYTQTPRPLDTAGLRSLVSRDVVLVEPYLAGTSSRLVAEALRDVPHRELHLGVSRSETRHYGSPADHARDPRPRRGRPAPLDHGLPGLTLSGPDTACLVVVVR